MEEEINHSALKQEINCKRAKLDKIFIWGINEEVINLSQELDELIMIYTLGQINWKKTSKGVLC